MSLEKDEDQTPANQAPARKSVRDTLIAFVRLVPGGMVVARWIKPNVTYFWTTKQPTLWMAGLIVGAIVGATTIAFRELIGVVQLAWLRDMSEFVATAARAQPWWVVLLAPAFGGLLVGLMLEKLMSSRRAFGVADVIEARVMSGRNVSVKEGFFSAIISAVSLGFGASTGREGPVVHLGATISAFFSKWLNLAGKPERTLLACGVASAVSASFNAPIAGVLFAHEVILGHYAATAFVPIAIASVAGTVLSRIYFGETAAFLIPDYDITSYWEFPAFALLGLVCAFVAIAFQASLVGTDWVARNIKMRLLFRPIIGGFLIGFIALFYPEVLGVGYEATNLALLGKLSLTTLIALLFAKIIATAITFASRFGGGVFSPALYLGAMAGGAFGVVASGIFPDLSSSGGVYAILGMGAVAASVIGAPISTVLIVFELTGGYEITIALMVTIAISYGLTQAFHGRSFFHWQLEMRGLFVQDGPHKYLLKNARVSEVMQPIDDEDETSFDPASGEAYLRPTDTLEAALRAFDTGGRTRILVVDNDDATKVIAHLQQVDVLRQFNSALISTSEEEHR